MKNAIFGYIYLKGSLNNNNNPFIKSSKEMDINKNILSQNNEDDHKIKKYFWYKKIK